MTTPNNTVAGLPAKWREEAEHMHTGPYEARILRKNAGELEAALASPAPSAGVGVDEAMIARAEAYMLRVLPGKSTACLGGTFNFYELLIAALAGEEGA